MNGIHFFLIRLTLRTFTSLGPSSVKQIQWNHCRHAEFRPVLMPIISNGCVLTEFLVVVCTMVYLLYCS